MKIQKLSGSKMRWPDLPSPLVVIFGPTAVGKTEIAIDLAERFDAEIVSADSRLFYRGMDIGTAKPNKAELRRVPHHLIDITDPGQVLSLAVYKKAAEESIYEIQERGKLPFLVGGTGQYIQAVLEDWSIPAQEPNMEIRQALSDWSREIGSFELHRKLSTVDPIAASNIQASNVRRTIRALEVIFLTGQRFSDQRKRQVSRYSLLKIGLRRSRTELYQRIDLRIQNMIEAGFVDEVRNLLDKGYDPTLPTMSAIGYQEICAYLDGKITLDEAIVQIKRRTRIFVRRQANWFKEKDPSIHWLTVTADTVNDIADLIESKEFWVKAEQPAINMEG